MDTRVLSEETFNASDWHKRNCLIMFCLFVTRCLLLLSLTSFCLFVTRFPLLVSLTSNPISNDERSER
jgi:hypothetical protein